MKFQKEDSQRIQRIVENFEKKSAAELVVVIKKASFTGKFEALGISFILYLLLLSFVIYAPFDISFDFFYLPLESLVLCTFFYFLLLFFNIPHKIHSSLFLQEKVRQRASFEFVHQQVYKTQKQTGILLYISLVEKQVEVIADFGIAKHLGKEWWQQWQKSLKSLENAEDPCALLENQLSLLGEQLSPLVPREENDENELSDTPQMSF